MLVTYYCGSVLCTIGFLGHHLLVDNSTPTPAAIRMAADLLLLLLGAVIPGTGVLRKSSCVVCASRSIPGFNGSEDCAALEQLLEGYDQQDQDQVSEVCNSPLFKYMDNDVSGPLVNFLPLQVVSPADLWIFYLYTCIFHVELLIKEPANPFELYCIWVMYVPYAVVTAYLLLSCTVMCVL